MINDTDYEIMNRLIENGYDSLTEEEQVRVDALEAEAKEEIRKSLSEDDLSSIRNTIDPNKSREYYEGLLAGFRKANEMLSNVNPMQFGDEYFIPMEQMGIISYFTAGYCIVLQDEYLKETES